LHLAGEVEIRRSGRQTGVEHRARRAAERTGRVENARRAAERSIQAGAIVERDDRRLQPVAVGERAHGGGVAAGQDRPLPARQRGFDDEAPGCAGRAVDEPWQLITHRSPPDEGNMHPGPRRCRDPSSGGA
jgi:hypothetical protein